MPSLGWQELIIVLIIVVIIFGAGKLPEIGGAMGKSIKEFKKESEDPNALPDGTSATTVASTRHGREVGRHQPGSSRRDLGIRSCIAFETAGFTATRPFLFQGRFNHAIEPVQYAHARLALLSMDTQ